MAIKNWTTEIPAVQTANEISGLLARRGARAIQIEYGPPPAGEPQALSFVLIHRDELEGQAGIDRKLAYRLPIKEHGVAAALVRDGVERRFRTPEHARRVAWRIAKDWLTAQLALIDAGGAEPTEVFLPYLLVGPDETLHQRFLARPQQFLLTEGGAR